MLLVLRLLVFSMLIHGPPTSRQNMRLRQCCAEWIRIMLHEAAGVLTAEFFRSSRSRSHLPLRLGHLMCPTRQATPGEVVQKQAQRMRPLLQGSMQSSASTVGGDSQAPPSRR